MIAPFEVNLRTQGREKKMAQLYARRLAGAAGEAGGADSGSGMILHFIDVTEQKSLETQFAQSQKMQAVGQLAGGVAHDFNNLLTAMIGFCDLLLLRHRPATSRSPTSCRSSRTPTGPPISCASCWPSRASRPCSRAFSTSPMCCPNCSHLLRRLIGENIELKMCHGRDLGLVKVDQGQLEQVIINLAVNARDAMPAAGR